MATTDTLNMAHRQWCESPLRRFTTIWESASAFGDKDSGEGIHALAIQLPLIPAANE
ncbi:hypothetical protein KCP75_04405 [Salmonella enterica subsp. enterica]|nr:hypothetical protein KCP75_04405 [Salmonella enterica subsp. enterica]